MAPRIVEGIYRDGRVEFSEPPEGLPDGARVRVTLVAPGDNAEDREALRQKAFARMRQGIDFGGAPYPTRDEIYGERIDELDRRRGL